MNYFILLYCTNTIYKLTTQFARGLGHVKRYAFYGVLNSLLLVMFNIIFLVILHQGISAYLVSFSLSYGISGIVSFVLSREYIYLDFTCCNKKSMKQMLKYSFPNIPNMISWWINSVSDRYIIMWFMGSKVTGLYTAASKLPAMINLVSSIFQQAWQYSASKFINTSNNKSFFSNVFRGYAYICVVSCGILILFNKLICHILLHSTFYSAWKFVPLLLLAATFGCISTYFGTFYQALKNNKILMISTLLGAVVNIILNFVLIPIIGGIGAAIATLMSYLLVMSIRIIDLNSKINIDINFGKLSFQFVFLLIMGFLAMIETNYFIIFAEIVILFMLIFTEKEIILKILKKRSRI